MRTPVITSSLILNKQTVLSEKFLIFSIMADSASCRRRDLLGRAVRGRALPGQGAGSASPVTIVLHCPPPRTAVDAAYAGFLVTDLYKHHP